MGQGPASVGLVYDHLFPLSYGGAEKVYRLLGDALVEQGVNVMYLTRFQGAIKPGNSFPFHVDVIWEGQLYDSSGTRRIGPALAWSLAVFRALRRHRFDAVVLSATPIFNVLVGMVLKCFQPSVRLVIDWPEIWPLRKWTSYSGAVTGTIAWMLQSVCLRVGKIKLVNSDATLERLPAIARKSAMKMPLLTMAGPPVGSGPGFPTNELLFVGRHIPDKNLPMLPRVLAALQTEYPDIHATVVGEGPDRKVAESVASDLGVSDRISFVGRVDDDELARRLQAAGVLFFPSVREGFGLVVCEAALTSRIYALQSEVVLKGGAHFDMQPRTGMTRPGH